MANQFANGGEPNGNHRPYHRTVPGFALGDADGGFFIVRVDQVPEKKGVLFKHVEYEVISKTERVPRRFNDFVVLHELIEKFFPNRLIPRLPPKSVGADDSFMVKRKRALARYISLLAHNPVIGKSQILHVFLTQKNSDVQTALKSKFKADADEFSQAPAKDYEHIRVTESAERITQLKNHMTSLENGVLKLKTTMEAVCTAGKEQVKNFMALNVDLNNFCSLSGNAFEGNSADSGALNDHHTKVLTDVASEVATITKQWLELSTVEENMVLEYVLLMKDLVKGWKDLLERQGKNVAADQKTVAKAASTKPRDQGQIEERSGNWTTAENRMKFSLLCMQQELEFLQSLFAPLMSLYLRHYAVAENQQLQKMAIAWDDIAIMADCIPGSATSSTVKPSAPF